MNITDKIDKYLSEAKSKIVVYDNGGKTADRYTVFIGDDVFGMSDDPTSPQGFNQYSGTTDEIKMGSHLGKKLSKIPKELIKAIRDRIKHPN